MLKRIVTLAVLVITALVTTLSLTGCDNNRYTKEEHISRVSERIEKRFITGSTELTGFQVFPLYDEGAELKYFLVEFEPYGFLYIRINANHSTIGSWFGGVGSMYTLSDTEIKTDWSRYTIDETNSQPFPDTDIIWEVDDNGNRIIYRKSPYSIAEVRNAKKYLLGNVPAIETETGYLNLVSMTDVIFTDGEVSRKQAGADISFINKGHFDL
jgi:hypothetical protein